MWKAIVRTIYIPANIKAIFINCLHIFLTFYYPDTLQNGVFKKNVEKISLFLFQLYFFATFNYYVITYRQNESIIISICYFLIFNINKSDMME